MKFQLETNRPIFADSERTTIHDRSIRQESPAFLRGVELFSITSLSFHLFYSNLIQKLLKFNFNNNNNNSN